MPLANPIEVNLWEMAEAQDNAIQAPLDPADYGIDPLLPSSERPSCKILPSCLDSSPS